MKPFAPSLPLSRGLTAFVDDADFDWASQWKWHATLGGYAARNAPVGGGRRRTLFLHNALAERWGLVLKSGEQLDHIDRDRRNNRRANFRIVVHDLNVRNASRRRDNSSGAKGVNWHKLRGKWVARIRVSTQLIVLGYFDDVSEAAAVYAEASHKYHGEYGCVG